MKSLCIKTNNSNLLQYLLNELNDIDLEHVCFSEKQFKHYKNIIIHYTGSDDSLFIKKISSFLALLVIDELEEELINTILIQNYFYFDINERKQILDLYFDITANDLSNIFDKKFKTLFESFYCFLSSHKSLVLKGFINFRVKSYMEILDDIVNEAVNSFIIEKEYLEFISLLRLYINSQPKGCENVHIIYSSENSTLLDENRKVINISEKIFKAKYLSDITFSSNDYILNSLLTLLPRKIYIHLLEPYLDEFIHTLQAIFEDRITLCTDCDICKLYKDRQTKKDLHTV